MGRDLLHSSGTVRIRRTNFLDVVQNAISGTSSPPSPEEQLIAERDRRQQEWQSHLHSYISVNAGLLVMNLVTATISGAMVPWAIFPMLGWGMGLGIHMLNHRAWEMSNREAVRSAEEQLGIAPPPQAHLLTSGSDDDPWPDLLMSCEAAVVRARALMTEVHPAATEALTDLQDGLATVERLAESADRVQQVLDGMQTGPRQIDTQIAALDKKIGNIQDDALREAELANRALLVARRAKIDALHADRDRMLAKARGFLLAVENLHLDAARLSGPDASDGLSAPIHRLTEEVEILRSVDAELKQLS